MKKTYELFTGENLKIAELIQQRRYQMLVHSCIYYVLNDNIIDDRQWDEWAKELKALQEQYSEIAQQVTLNEYFNDWDASTGEFLPIRETWVIDLAKYVLRLQNISYCNSTLKVINKVDSKKIKNSSGRRKLF